MIQHENPLDEIVARTKLPIKVSMTRPQFSDELFYLIKHSAGRSIEWQLELSAKAATRAYFKAVKELTCD